MLEQIAILGISAVGAVSFWFLISALIRMLNEHANCLEKAGEFSDAAYKNAQVLIKDDSTPEIVIDFIYRFFPHIGKADLARYNTSASILQRVRKQTPNQGATDTPLSKALKEMPMDKRKCFVLMMLNGIASSSAADPFLAHIHFREFFYLIGEEPEKVKSMKTANITAMSSHVDEADIMASSLYRHYAGHRNAADALQAA